MSQNDTLSHYNYASADGLNDAGPTLWICALFVALYGVSTSGHLVEAIYWRKWFIFPTILLAGFGELIGWAARLWSSKNPALDTPFLMQISTTIIAPTFLSAANFIILGRVVRECRGEIYSRLSPRRYSQIFLTIDIIALVIQAAGGGLASSMSDPNLGGNIMLAGILIQLVAIVTYCCIAGEFIYRLYANAPIASRLTAISGGISKHSDVELADRSANSSASMLNEKAHGVGRSAGLSRRLQLMIAGLAFSSLLLFIRAVYRTAELSDGWTGRIIQTEVYFNVLDGGMVTLAMFTLNVLHPGWLLSSQ